MKYISIIALILVLFMVAAPVLAQDPTPTPILDPDGAITPPPEIPGELPNLAVDAFNLVVAIVASLFSAFVGFIQFTVVKVLKEHVSWLSKENREKLGVGLTRLLILIFNTIVGAGVVWAMPHIAQLDATGVWGAVVTLVSVAGLPVIVAGTPVFAEIWHRLSKIMKSPAVS